MPVSYHIIIKANLDSIFKDYSKNIPTHFYPYLAKKYRHLKSSIMLYAIRRNLAIKYHHETSSNNIS